jgi:predicted DNA-binding WGR domain protein
MRLTSPLEQSMSTTLTRFNIELRQVDPSRGRARRYHLAEARSLFGELALFISWGRIGRAPRVRLETFATEAALHARWEELLARRAAHDYRLHAGGRKRAAPSATPTVTKAEGARARSAAPHR